MFYLFICLFVHMVYLFICSYGLFVYKFISLYVLFFYMTICPSGFFVYMLYLFICLFVLFICLFVHMVYFFICSCSSCSLFVHLVYLFASFIYLYFYLLYSELAVEQRPCRVPQVSRALQKSRFLWNCRLQQADSGDPGQARRGLQHL